MFAREVPALDLSAISLCVINDNEFLRSYMERLFGIMRVGRVVTFENTAIAPPFISRRGVFRRSLWVTLIGASGSATYLMGWLHHIPGEASLPRG